MPTYIVTVEATENRTYKYRVKAESAEAARAAYPDGDEVSSEGTGEYAGEVTDVEEEAAP